MGIKVGKPLIVFVNITLEKQREDLLAHFERKMSAEPEVMQCYFVSGDTDYLLIIHVKDMSDYNEFARRIWSGKPGKICGSWEILVSCIDVW